MWLADMKENEAAMLAVTATSLERGGELLISWEHSLHQTGGSVVTAR